LTSPLLTIAIPTWNRELHLQRNLDQLRSEMQGVASGLVEILVSDNCSPDATPAVVESAIKSGLPIRYVRNDKNLGWALNFVQCFDLARGQHVLLLGDDDLFVDGALPMLLNRLAGRNYGVVCLRPYGFDNDFRKEHPGGSGREREFNDANRFLIAISRYFTLTSACVVNKSLLPAVDSKQFVDTNLATLHLMLRAALAAEKNLFIDKYLIASKRQNSFSYEFAKVFVGELWRIIDAQVPHGLSRDAVHVIERDKMLSYYPFYLLDLRLSGRGDLQVTRDQFASRFEGRWLLKYWLEPTIRLPRPIAILWGAATTFIGRVMSGDLRRGIMFGWNRFTRSFAGKRRGPGTLAGSLLS
jgi:glycosyltransferase involved in cell wall biosynthesis